VVMYVVCIYCIFYMYANHDLRKCCHVELTTGMSAILPPTTRTPSIFGEPFLLVRTDRTACCHGIVHSYCIKKQTLKTNHVIKTHNPKDT
jgi:hypothetical protein